MSSDKHLFKDSPAKVMPSLIMELRTALIDLQAACDRSGHPGHHDDCDLCAANLKASETIGKVRYMVVQL